MNTSTVSATEETYSQASQDLFVLKTLHYKRNGTFLEIGPEVIHFYLKINMIGQALRYIDIQTQ